MITGFNTDIKHNEKVYHIQTEDKGLQNPYIESLVYVGGEILASKKTSYAEQAKDGVDEKWVGGLMEQQHRTMIAAIKRGRFDQPADVTREGLRKSPITDSTTPTPPDFKTFTQLEDDSMPVGSVIDAAGDDRTLDQVIIDYLASEADNEHLELSLLNQNDFISGMPVEIRVATKKSLSQSPIAGATIEVKVISTIEAPRVVYKGKTGPDGAAVVRCTIPVFNDGTAAVIISARSPLGNDEVKQLVKRKK